MVVVTLPARAAAAAKAQRWRRAWAAAWWLVALLPSTGALAAGQATEAELHAAYVINFMKYTQWPAPLDSADPRLVIIGTAEEFTVLRTMADGTGAVNGRPLRIVDINLGKRGRSDAGDTRLREALRDAHAVFVAPSHRGWNQAVVQAAGSNLLTIGMDPGFTASGGMLGLFNREGRVAFAANVEKLRSAGPLVSSRVLKIARAAPEKAH